MKTRLINSALVFGITCSVTLADRLVTYVSNSGDNTVSMISLDSLRVVNTIPAGEGPGAMVLTPDGSRLYVANLLSHNVSVIDTFSHSVIRTVPVGDSPSALTVSRDGRHVYVVNSGSSSVSVIGTAANIVEVTVPTPPSPSAIAYHPVRDELWLGFNTPGTVLAVLSAENYAILASHASSARFYGSAGLQFRPDGTEVFGTEACGCCGRFHRISGLHSGDTIIVLQEDLFSGGDWAAGVAVHPSNGTAYFAQHGHCSTPPAPRISELGGANRVLPLVQAPQALAVIPGGDQICIVGTNSLLVVDLATFATVTNIVVGTAPRGIAVGRINRSPTLNIKVASVQLCWNTVSNAQYQVEYRSDAATDTWQPVGDAMTGNGSTICITDSALESPKRFYRVRLVE